MKPPHQRSAETGITHPGDNGCAAAAQPGQHTNLGTHLLNLTSRHGTGAPPASLPVHHLLHMARQTGLCDIEKCTNTLGIMALGREVRQKLLEALQQLQLSETRFLALVTLFSLDPVPSNPADLAHHADSTRPSMTEALNQMEARGWITRQHIQDDRRVVHVHLTNEGRELAATAIRHFLERASALGDGLSLSQQRAFNGIFTRILNNTTRTNH